MTKRARFSAWRKMHPVRFVSAVAGTVQLSTQGLVLFQVWHPTVDQLAYVNGLVVALAAVWGVSAAMGAERR